jgi:hypothetical protein
MSWESEDIGSKTWSRFAPDDNRRLETAFAAKEKSVKLDFGGKAFTVDFATMKMSAAKADPVRAVRRVQAAANVEPLLNELCGSAQRLTEPEQFVRVFEALGVNPEGIESFVLFYKAGAATPLSITREELTTLFSVQGLPTEKTAAQRKVNEWTTQIMAGGAEFDPFYTFVWKWNRASSTAQIVTLDVAFPIWRLTTATLRLPLLDQLMTFYESKLRGGVPLDLWVQSLKFARQVKLPGFQGYSEDDCWPSMIDDFVEVAKKK